MKSLEKIKTQLKQPRTQVVLSLAVGVAGMLGTEVSQSAVAPPAGCSPGSNGDCDQLTNGTYACTVGGFWDDCK